MEICDSDLKKLCRTDVSLQDAHVSTLLYNLLVGVKYLHSVGIYHRDLKPANCLVNQDCSVKISDFKLSRAAGGSGRMPDEPCERPLPRDSLRLRRHAVVMNQWYRAPELILRQQES